VPAGTLAWWSDWRQSVRTDDCSRQRRQFPPRPVGDGDSDSDRIGSKCRIGDKLPEHRTCGASATSSSSSVFAVLRSTLFTNNGRRNNSGKTATKNHNLLQYLQHRFSAQLYRDKNLSCSFTGQLNSKIATTFSDEHSVLPVLNNFMSNRSKVKSGDCKSSQFVNIKRQHKETIKTIKTRCRLVDTRMSRKVV